MPANRRIRLVFAAIIGLLTVMLGGCIVTDAPIVSMKSAVNDPNIIGRWKAPDGKTQFQYMQISATPTRGIMSLTRKRFDNGKHTWGIQKFKIVVRSISGHDYVSAVPDTSAMTDTSSASIERVTVNGANLTEQVCNEDTARSLIKRGLLRATIAKDAKGKPTGNITLNRDSLVQFLMASPSNGDNLFSAGTTVFAKY